MQGERHHLSLNKKGRLPGYPRGAEPSLPLEMLEDRRQGCRWALKRQRKDKGLHLAQGILPRGCFKGRMENSPPNQSPKGLLSGCLLSDTAALGVTPGPDPSMPQRKTSVPVCK